MTSTSHSIRLLAAAFMVGTGLAAAAPAAGQTASPDAVAALVERLNRLEVANSQLAAEVDRLKQGSAAPVAVAAPPVAAHAPTATPMTGNPDISQTIGVNPEYGYRMLDHAENVNRRAIMLLEARRDGEINDLLTISGGVSVIADAHWSNRANKFGYLMRHPSGANQRTTATQEITINSAQLALTIAPAADISAYVEMLYDPEQSFGAGTLTALARNQVQVRKAYVMVGNLNKSPFYVAAGKMDVPFGLQDTVSPFTNSTNWHAFAPLAYGGQVGYLGGGLSLRAMAVVGGAQFRGANTPVDGTNIPSKVNNFSVDGSYRYQFGEDLAAMVGGSYLLGSAYCQNYPVTHFSACSDNVPAWAAYGKIDAGRIHLLGEFARTTKVWPGTKVPVATNPALAVFDASRVTSFTVGGRYNLPVSDLETNLSLEFSKFIAGADGSPWERQTQWVAGLSHRLVPSVDLFGELIRTEGFVPLNFLSGGNQPAGATWSEKDARSHVIMMGIQAAF